MNARPSTAELDRLVARDHHDPHSILGAHAFDGGVTIRALHPAADAIVVRPKLIEAFNDIREYGVSIDKLIDIHEQVLPLVDQISAILVQAGLEHVQDRIKPGVGLPDDTEVAELITMLVRFRTQAVAAVTATLASSIESTIEELVSRILADYVENSSGEQTQNRTDTP